MSYDVDISPTGLQALSDLVGKYPFPGLLTAIQEGTEAVARNPLSNRSPSVFGRPTFIVEFRTPEDWTLYIQVAYRLTEDEKRLQITDVAAVSF